MAFFETVLVWYFGTDESWFFFFLPRGKAAFVFGISTVGSEGLPRGIKARERGGESWHSDGNVCSGNFLPDIPLDLWVINFMNLRTVLASNRAHVSH